jgi:orotate phosphoribosyltransferase
MTHCNRPTFKDAWSLVLHRLRRDAIKRGLGIDKRGKRLGWLIDCREVLMQADCHQAVGMIFWDTIKAQRATHVGGVTLSADPITCAVLSHAAGRGDHIYGFSIRKQRKEWGLRRLIEGVPIVTDSRVVLVDDILDSGNTMRYALGSLQPIRAKIVAACFIVNFGRSGERLLRNLGIPVYFAYTLDEVLQHPSAIE